MRIKHSASLAAAIAAASAFGTAALAWAEPQHAPATRSLQEHPAGVTDAHLHAFYDMLKEARGRGAEKVDAALEKTLREMARTFPAGTHGLSAKDWEDHVVDMAGQMLALGKQDPKIFQSYDSFVVALRGPQ